MVTTIPKGGGRRLACIPSAESVRNRLDAVLDEARKLKILLTTAEQLERASLPEGDHHE